MRESNLLIIISSKVWLQTELDDMMSCYQLIKTMKKFQKQTTCDLFVFIKKTLLGEMRDKGALIWGILSNYTSMTCTVSY